MGEYSLRYILLLSGHAKTECECGDHGHDATRQPDRQTRLNPLQCAESNVLGLLSCDDALGVFQHSIVFYKGRGK